jgi:DNA-binding CsgD family transcriptional regulator
VAERTDERRRTDPGRRVADLWLRLTPRQRQVLDLVAAGAPNKEIAAQLRISEQAAKQQVSKLLTRFGVGSRAALASSALALRITGQRDSDLPLEYLFDLAPVAMALTRGPDHVFSAVNRTFVDLFGERDGWIGSRLRDVLTGSEAALLPLVDAIYRSGERSQRASVPIQLTGADGGSVDRTLTVTTQPTHGPEGTVTGLVFFGVDVTEQIALSARLDTIREERERIVEQMRAVSVLIVDRDGRTTWTAGPLQDALRPALDRNRSIAAQARRWAARWTETGEPLTEADSPSARALAGERVSEMVTFEPSPGRHVHARVSGQPVRDTSGAVVSAVIVIEVTPAD